MPILSFEDTVVSTSAAGSAPLSSSSMTLFPVGMKKLKATPLRSISADSKFSRRPNSRLQDTGSSTSIPCIYPSLSPGSAVFNSQKSMLYGPRLTLQAPPVGLHSNYQKWRIKHSPTRRELSSQGDGKVGLKDAIQKMNRLTLNGKNRSGVEIASRQTTARERKNVLKTHITDISNLFNTVKSAKPGSVVKTTAKKEHDIKTDIRKYFEANSVAMSLLNSMTRVTALKLYKPKLAPIIEETKEELSRA